MKASRGSLCRIAVCRLELTFDPKSDKLRVAPMNPDEPNHKRRKIA